MADFLDQDLSIYALWPVAYGRVMVYWCLCYLVIVIFVKTETSDCTYSNYTALMTANKQLAFS